MGINRQAIMNTVECYWSEEDDAFVVESPMADRIAGVGETREEARRVFEDLLEDMVEAEKQGRLVGYDGRGNAVVVRTEIKSMASDQLIKEIRDDAEMLGMNLDEMLEYLHRYYRFKKAQEEKNPKALR